MSDLAIVALVCPACSERLRGSAGDVAFACPACGEACEIEGSGLARRESVWPAHASEPDLRLPFWLFDVEVRFSGDDGAKVDALASLVRPGRVFVPAFRQRNAVAFGDMGLLMTYRPPQFEAGRPGRMTGATVGSGMAARLVEPMVLWRADQVRDVTGIDVSVAVRRTVLLPVPAREEADRLVELLGGRSWPRAAFMDPGSFAGGYLR